VTARFTKPKLPPAKFKNRAISSRGLIKLEESLMKLCEELDLPIEEASRQQTETKAKKTKVVRLVVEVDRPPLKTD